MPSKQQRATEISQNLAMQLDWQTAERNDEAVAQLLYAGEKADEIHTLDEAGLLDGFFAFLLGGLKPIGTRSCAKGKIDHQKT